MTTQSNYIPGMCNINTAEVAYRRKAMWFGTALSVIFFGVLVVVNIVWWIGVLILFLPVFIGAINFLQVRNKFCVSYGGSGRQNADEGSEAAHAITDETALAADKVKTKRMNRQATMISVAVLVVAGAVLALI